MKKRTSPREIIKPAFLLFFKINFKGIQIRQTKKIIIKNGTTTSFGSKYWMFTEKIKRIGNTDSKMGWISDESDIFKILLISFTMWKITKDINY